MKVKDPHSGLVFPILAVLVATVACGLFKSGPKLSKATDVVDFPSMVGKSLQEMTTMLGEPRQQVLCYHWELSEGEIVVCYETSDPGKKFMSSLSYALKADREVGSPAEMMSLIKVDARDKEPERDRRGFFTYKGISVNGKSCFVDVHPRNGLSAMFREPSYAEVQLYIQNPEIHLYSSTDLNGSSKTFYEQQTNEDLKVGSVLLGHGNWELCTEANFSGKCKILDGISREYLDNSKNFSAFGLGETIRSLRPVEKR